MSRGVAWELELLMSHAHTKYSAENGDKSQQPRGR
jgi:hypothetical protein